jgi:F-type H+-transporting ATPase subunit delta
MYFKKKNMVLAKIQTAGEISDGQLEELRNFIIKRFGYSGVEFEIEQNESLIGGFILKVDDFEYDKSIKGMMNKLKIKLTGK